MAKVRKNKRASYWEVDYKDTFGKRKVKGGFPTKVKAEDFLATVLNEIKNGTAVEINKEITFREAAELYMRLYVEVHCKPTTVYGYQGYLDKHILPYFGDMKLIQITPIAIKEFIYQKLQTDLANSSINKFKKLISAIYNKMIDDEVVIKNPVARIKSLKEIKTKDVRSLSIKEVQALLTKTKQVYPDFYPLLFSAIYTGMRQGELLALTWDSINWQTSKVVVDKGYTHGRLGSTKTDRIRYVDLSSQLAKVLKEWKLACPHSPHDLVFPNSDGEYMDANNMLKRRFKPALSRAGISAIRFHDLRHTYASLLLAKNVSMKYIQHQLGHTTIKTTMDIYTHLLPEVSEQCVLALDELVEFKDEPMKRFGT